MRPNQGGDRAVPTDPRHPDRVRGTEDWQGDPHPAEPAAAHSGPRHELDQPAGEQPPAQRTDPSGGHQPPAHQSGQAHGDNRHTTAVDDQRARTDPATADIPTQRDRLFSAREADSYRSRWHNVQGAFVDNPAEAVEEADKLLVDAMKTLAEHKRTLETWRDGAQTEDLRQALRGYRAFLDKLLQV